MSSRNQNCNYLQQTKIKALWSKMPPWIIDPHFSEHKGILLSVMSDISIILDRETKGKP